MAIEKLQTLTHRLIGELRRIRAEEAQAPPVLVVEDDKTDRELICYVLRELGCHVDTATTVKEAVDLVYRHAAGPGAYLMVFLDLNLHGGDGLEVLDMLRKLIPLIPVVIVTGLIADGYRLQRASELGYFGLVEKPLSEDRARQIFSMHRVPMPVNLPPAECGDI